MRDASAPSCVASCRAGCSIAPPRSTGSRPSTLTLSSCDDRVRSLHRPLRAAHGRVRPTPERPWFVALGVGRVVEFVTSFGYGPKELVYLESVGVDAQTLDWLGALDASSEAIEIWAVDDGTIVCAEEPIVEITARLPF